MFRTSDVILIAVMLSAAAFTYKTKHDAEAVMERISELETQIQLEKDTIDVLNADWSLLTQPGRLERLAEVYKDELGLEIMEPKQIIQAEALGGIPFPEQPIVAEGELGQDPTITGGVQQ